MKVVTIDELWMEKAQTNQPLYIFEKAEKEHGAPSLRPPKKWFKEKIKEVKTGNEGIKNPEAVAGHIWYNKMEPKNRKEARKDEGKKYGPAPEQKAMYTGTDADLGGKCVKGQDEEDEKKKELKKDGGSLQAMEGGSATPVSGASGVNKSLAEAEVLKLAQEAQALEATQIELAKALVSCVERFNNLVKTNGGK